MVCFSLFCARAHIMKWWAPHIESKHSAKVFSATCSLFAARYRCIVSYIYLFIFFFTHIFCCIFHIDHDIFLLLKLISRLLQHTVQLEPTRSEWSEWNCMKNEITRAGIKDKNQQVINLIQLNWIWMACRNSN